MNSILLARLNYISFCSLKTKAAPSLLINSIIPWIINFWHSKFRFSTYKGISTRCYSFTLINFQWIHPLIFKYSNLWICAWTCFSVPSTPLYGVNIGQIINIINRCIFSIYFYLYLCYLLRQAIYLILLVF